MDNTKGVDCAYPGVEVLPAGTFVVTTYGHWTEGEPPYIVSVRFTLPELDDLTKPQGDGLYGIAPGFRDAEAGDVRLPADNPAQR
jgi:hypothetical protein